MDLIRKVMRRYLSFLHPIMGLASFLFMCGNVFFWALLIHLVAPFMLLKSPAAEERTEQCFNRIYHGWVVMNEWWFRHILGIQWDLDDTMQPDLDRWSLIVANHRSWVDVFVIFAQLKGRRTLPRVFMKHTLLWLPLVGTAALLTGFPVVKRYTRAQLEKNPKLIGKDLETTKRSCRRLVKRPSSIMSFAEGTRFSVEKHKQQNSPYTCLLKPKAGGIGFILQSMPNKFRTITDINVLYDQKNISGWDLLCGRLATAKITVREVSFPDSMFAPDFQAASKDREEFFVWFNLYWKEKDTRMSHQLALLTNHQRDSEKIPMKGNTSQE